MLLLGTAVITVVGRPEGAPTSACATITPDHGGSMTSDPVPYDVDISSLDDGYVPGQSYPSECC